MDDMLHDRYRTWDIRTWRYGTCLGKYGTGEILYNGRYVTWEIWNIGNMVHERYGTREIWYI